MKRIVVTGGPCCGKTSLVNVFKKRGYTVLEESALQIINALTLAQGFAGQLEWRQKNHDEFHRMIDDLQVQQESETQADIVIMDRSRIDALAYLVCSNSVPAPEFLLELSAYRLDQVWMLQPLPFFHARLQTGRAETLQEATHIHRALRHEYESRCYNVVDIPLLPLDERVEYCISLLG